MEPPRFELESELTDTQHETSDVWRREVETTLRLPHLRSVRSASDWMSLPTHTAEKDIKWEVQFWRGGGGGDLGVDLRCAHLQYGVAASVRLLATLDADSHNWAERAAVLRNNDININIIDSGYFRKSVQFGGSVRHRVRVRVRWTPVEQLLGATSSHVVSCAAPVQCRWQLRGIKTTRPTADWRWKLWSELFGNAALWRMSVVNWSDGRLAVGVHLQHMTEEMENQKLQWSCQLTHGDTQFTSNSNNNMEKDSYCGWTVVEDVNELTSDIVELHLLICITQRQ